MSTLDCGVYCASALYGLVHTTTIHTEVDALLAQRPKTRNAVLSAQKHETFRLGALFVCKTKAKSLFENNLQVDIPKHENV